MDYGNAWYVVASSPKTPRHRSPMRHASSRLNNDPQLPVRTVFEYPAVEDAPRKVIKPYVQWFFYYAILGELIDLRQRIVNKIAVTVVAACGLVYQLNEIANLYFQYETVTVFEIETPLELRVPALSLCFPYEQIADLKEVEKMIPSIAGMDPENITISNLSTLKLEDLFRITPSEKNMTSACVYRAPMSFKRLEGKGNCEGIFNVTKFFKQKFICYKFALVTKTNGSFIFDMIQNSLSSPGIFYDLTFSIKLPRVDEFQAVIHSPNLYPRGNKAFPISVSRVSAVIPFKGEKIKRKDFVFSFSYSLAINILLPAPYKSNCKIYGMDAKFESKEGCMDLCLTEGVREKIKKIPFSAVQLLPEKFPHISVADNSDAKINEENIGIRKKCAAQCNQNNCHDEMFITKFIRSSFADDLNFRVYVTNEPVIRSTLQPKLQTIEFLVYVLSCFGIWFGASFYSFSAVITKVSSTFKGTQTVK